MSGSNREAEAGAVEDASRNGHLQLMMAQLCAAALAPVAGLGPRFAAAAAVVARAADGHFERYHRAVARFSRREADRRAQRGGALIFEKSVPHAIDCRGDRRKVDDDLVREAAGIGTSVGAVGKRYRTAAERTKGASAHELLLTIWAARGEVNQGARRARMRGGWRGER